VVEALKTTGGGIHEPQVHKQKPLGPKGAPKSNRTHPGCGYLPQGRCPAIIVVVRHAPTLSWKGFYEKGAAASQSFERYIREYQAHPCIGEGEVRTSPVYSGEGRRYTCMLCDIPPKLVGNINKTLTKYKNHG
jgi:hypothetical protein